MEVHITHIGTATAIIDINGIRFLTDPVFPEAGTEYQGKTTVLKTPEIPALRPEELPSIHGVLLSHEDHPDNLDDIGRRFLTGRPVVTTSDGKRNIDSSRSDVYGLQPWETISLDLGKEKFTITATPCQHLPGGERIGFLVQAESFGVDANGLPNAIYISGDTVYIDELKKIPQKVHVVVAILNLGAARVTVPSGPLQITMDGKQAAQLIRDLNPDYVVPMHFESWSHFTENKDALVRVFDEEKLGQKISWLVPGERTKIV